MLSLKAVWGLGQTQKLDVIAYLLGKRCNCWTTRCRRAVIHRRGTQSLSAPYVSHTCYENTEGICFIFLNIWHKVQNKVYQMKICHLLNGFIFCLVNSPYRRKRCVLNFWALKVWSRCGATWCYENCHVTKLGFLGRFASEMFSVSREKQQLGTVLKVYIMHMGIYSKVSWILESYLLL